MSKWRPIDEYQLPPFDAEHWYIPDNAVLVFNGHWPHVASYGYTRTGKGRWLDMLGRVCHPTHWMPLPEPPEDAL